LQARIKLIDSGKWRRCYRTHESLLKSELPLPRSGLTG
jgi:hypothetical protein